jgi:uncharacterized cupredoxin-like copper-binding protein
MIYGGRMSLWEAKMAERNDPDGHFPFDLVMAASLAAFAVLSVAGALAQGPSPAGSSNETMPLEVTIVSTEFKFLPSKVRVPAGRAVTLVLDNSGAETQHGIVLPAFGFRLEVNAGGIARKTIVFDKPGNYEFNCDLPGHREAGMAGTLIVSDSLAKR